MGQVISNKYEVVGELGRGGMGVVYKVRHAVLGKIYALKVLPTELLMDNQDLVARFYREAQMMAQLNHTNVIQVMDIDRDESRNWYYFVMEYIRGKSLKQHMKNKGMLPLPEVLEIGCQVARALVYAHRQSPPVIHRDIKPENIMIEEPRRRVVVLDFGIAKQLEAGSQFTAAGTPKYCAPEQLLGKPITGSVDVYSLGLVMYEMITGKQFFAGLDNKAIFTQALDNTRENEPFFDPPLPSALTAIITKAIAKSPENRYVTMLDFLQDLETHRRAMHLKDEATVSTLLSTHSNERQSGHMHSAPVEASVASPSRSPRVEPKLQPNAIGQAHPPTKEQAPVKPRLQSAAEQEQPWKGTAAPQQTPEQEVLLFNLDGKLNRERFTAEAFRSLVAATAESHSVGDRRIEVFHVLMSMMRGSYLKRFYQYLTRDTGKELDTELKLLRAHIRQAYRRPVVEKKLIVRELYHTDGAPTVLALLDAAAVLASPGLIEEKHLLTALLRETPVELLPILQENGMTLANLQRYIRESA